MITEHSVINSQETKYAARVWRTHILKAEAEKEIKKILQAFVPEGFEVKINEGNAVVGQETQHKFHGILRANPNGVRANSDAHFFVQADTRAAIYAKLLAVILENKGFFPLT